MAHIFVVGRSVPQLDAVASSKERDALHAKDMGHPAGRP